MSAMMSGMAGMMGGMSGMTGMAGMSGMSGMGGTGAASYSLVDPSSLFDLNGSVLLNDVKKGQPVTMADVDLSGLKTYELYKQGLEK